MKTTGVAVGLPLVVDRVAPAEVPEVGRRNTALAYKFFANSRPAVQNVHGDL